MLQAKDIAVDGIRWTGRFADYSGSYVLVGDDTRVLASNSATEPPLCPSRCLCQCHAGGDTDTSECHRSGEGGNGTS